MLNADLVLAWICVEKKENNKRHDENEMKKKLKDRYSNIIVIISSNPVYKMEEKKTHINCSFTLCLLSHLNQNDKRQLCRLQVGVIIFIFRSLRYISVVRIMKIHLKY